jgi:hypothetical protein
MKYASTRLPFPAFDFDKAVLVGVLFLSALPTPGHGELKIQREKREAIPNSSRNPSEGPKKEAFEKKPMPSAPSENPTSGANHEKTPIFTPFGPAHRFGRPLDEPRPAAAASLVTGGVLGRPNELEWQELKTQFSKRYRPNQPNRREAFLLKPSNDFVAERERSASLFLIENGFGVPLLAECAEKKMPEGQFRVFKALLHWVGRPSEPGKALFLERLTKEQATLFSENASALKNHGERYSSLHLLAPSLLQPPVAVPSGFGAALPSLVDQSWVGSADWLRAVEETQIQDIFRIEPSSSEKNSSGSSIYCKATEPLAAWQSAPPRSPLTFRDPEADHQVKNQLKARSPVQVVASVGHWSRDMTSLAVTINRNGTEAQIYSEFKSIAPGIEMESQKGGDGRDTLSQLFLRMKDDQTGVISVRTKPGSEVSFSNDYDFIQTSPSNWKATSRSRTAGAARVAEATYLPEAGSFQIEVDDPVYGKSVLRTSGGAKASFAHASVPMRYLAVLLREVEDRLFQQSDANVRRGDFLLDTSDPSFASFQQLESGETLWRSYPRDPSLVGVDARHYSNDAIPPTVSRSDRFSKWVDSTPEGWRKGSRGLLGKEEFEVHYPLANGGAIVKIGEKRKFLESDTLNKSTSALAARIELKDGQGNPKRDATGEPMALTSGSKVKSSWGSLGTVQAVYANRKAAVVFGKDPTVYLYDVDQLYPIILKK